MLPGGGCNVFAFSSPLWYLTFRNELAPGEWIYSRLRRELASH